MIPNPHGFKGVYALKRRKDGTQKYGARVKYQNRQYIFGPFSTAEEAGKCYSDFMIQKSHAEFSDDVFKTIIRNPKRQKLQSPKIYHEPVRPSNFCPAFARMEPDFYAQPWVY